jgi:hypothetical protein
MGVAFFKVIFECGEGSKPMFLYTSVGFISAVLNPTLRNIIPCGEFANIPFKVLKKHGISDALGIVSQHEGRFVFTKKLE